MCCQPKLMSLAIGEVTINDVDDGVLQRCLMLPMRDLLQAEQVCRRWRAVCRCPQRLQHLDLTDAPFNSQISRQLLERLIARSCRPYTLPTHQPESAYQQAAEVPCSAALTAHLSSPAEDGTQLPQAACGSQTGLGRTQAAEGLEGSARQHPSSEADAEAHLPQAAPGGHTDLEARPAATLSGAASRQHPGPQQSLIRHVTLRDCLGTWQTDSPRLQAPHNSELPSALLELILDKCPEAEVVDARGFGLKAGLFSLGSVNKIRQAIASRPQRELRALHLDLWCWSLGDAWDAYRGRWLGFEHSGSPVRLWHSLLAVLRDTSPIQVARLVFQGRHAPWQARTNCDPLELMRMRLNDLSTALEGNRTLTSVEVNPASQPELCLLMLVAQADKLDPRIKFNLAGPVSEEGPADRALRETGRSSSAESLAGNASQ